MNDPITSLRDIIVAGLHSKTPGDELLEIARAFIAAAGLPPAPAASRPMADRLLEEEQERPVVLGCDEFETSGATSVSVGFVFQPLPRGRRPIGLHINIGNRRSSSYHDILFADPEADLRAALEKISETAATCLRRLDGHE